MLVDALVGPSREMWALRHAIPESVEALGGLVAFDIAFRRGDATQFCERMAVDVPLKFPGVEVCHFGHIADGGVHFNLVARQTSPAFLDPHFEQNARDWLYDIVVNEFGGSFSAEHGIGRKNQRYFDRYTPDILLTKADALKTALSPSPIGVARFWPEALAY